MFLVTHWVFFTCETFQLQYLISCDANTAKTKVFSKRVADNLLNTHFFSRKNRKHTEVEKEINQKITIIISFGLAKYFIAYFVMQIFFLEWRAIASPAN